DRPARSASSLRKARLAQPFAEMFAILGALAEPRENTLVDCEPRFDTQRFGGLLLRPVELTKLSIGGGQIPTPVTIVGGTRRRFVQVRQSIQIAPEQVVGKSQHRRSARLVERIKSHVRLERLDGLSRLSSNQQRECKVIVSGIWIELDRALELGDGRVVLP